MERKPKIGLLGLMTGGYEDISPGILERQLEHGRSIAKILSDEMDVTFDRIGTDQAVIEEIVKEYNHQELDGILIVLLAYSQGTWRAVINVGLMVLSFFTPFPFDYFVLFCLVAGAVWALYTGITLRDRKKVKAVIFLAVLYLPLLYLFQKLAGSLW